MGEQGHRADGPSPPSRGVVAAVVGLLSLVLIGAVVGVFVVSRQAPTQPGFGASFRAVSIPRPGGGAAVTAMQAGAGHRVIVLSHGATGTKEDFATIGQAFADRGWRVMAYDGGSDRPADLEAVVAYARASGSTSVVLLGGSLGASLSIASAERLQAAAVVGLSPPSSAFDEGEFAAKLTMPVLFAASADDHPYAETTAALAAAAGVDPIIVSGKRHGSGVVVDHPELLERILQFCADAAP